MKESIETVFGAITSERTYQDAKWGDHTHSVGDFLVLMLCHVRRQPKADGVQGVVRRVTSLAVACREQYYQSDAMRVYDEAKKHLSLWVPGRKSLNTWVKTMEESILLAMEAFTSNRGDEEALKVIVAIIAQGVTAMQQHGAPHRDLHNVATAA